VKGVCGVGLHAKRLGPRRRGTRPTCGTLPRRRRNRDSRRHLRRPRSGRAGGRIWV